MNMMDGDNGSLLLIYGTAYYPWDIARIGMLGREHSYLEKLSEHFEEIYVLSMDANDVFPSLPENITYLHLPRVFQFSHTLRKILFLSLFSLYVLSKPLKVNVIYAREMSAGFPFLIISKILRKPSVAAYRYHWSEVAAYDRAKSRLNYKARKWIEQHVFANADSLITTTDNLKQRILDHGVPEEKISVVPIYVDTDLFKPPEFFSFPHEQGTLQILSIGRLVVTKNFDLIIDAIAILAKVLRIDIRLTIIGQGALKKDLLDHARKNNVNLTIISKVDNDQICGFMNAHDIFVLFSDIEGLPKVILESFSSGILVIGSDAEGICNLITNGETGFVCEKNPQSLADLLLKISSNAYDVAAITSNARELILKHYSPDLCLIREINVIRASHQ